MQTMHGKRKLSLPKQRRHTIEMMNDRMTGVWSLFFSHWSMTMTMKSADIENSIPVKSIGRISPKTLPSTQPVIQ